MRTLKQITDGLKRKEFSSEELISLYLKTIREKDKDIHAFLSVFEKEALEEAREADRRRADKKERGIFDGVPVALKDNLMTAEQLTTAGSKILEEYKATYDGTAVKRLKGQGFIVLGKTNLDEFAMGSSTENSAYGPTKNPHDLEKVPGGSSGGSAAAVATGMAPVSLGSDTGGSIRQPAAFCGVVGVKPTYGRVSRSGLIAMASSLDQIGPLAGTIDDAENIFTLIAGADKKDSTTAHYKYEFQDMEPKTLRIGIPKEYFTGGLDLEIKKAVDGLLSKLKHDFEVKDVSLPHTEYALPAYHLIMPSEISANLARFDGIRYGLRLEEDDIWNQYAKSRGEGFGEEVRRRIILGTYSLSAGYYDAYYKKASRIRSLIREDFFKVFKEVDVLITPTTPTPPFNLGEKADDPISMYLSDVLTVTANLSGIPALSLPLGKTKKDLPIGLQLMAGHWEENKLFTLGRYIEKLNSNE